MSLGDTSNESSQRDKSLPHNNSPEEKCSLTDDVKYSDEAEIIIEAKLSNHTSDNESPQHNISTEGTQNSTDGANDSQAAESDSDYNSENERDHIKNAAQMHQTARSLMV